ncbi:AraC family transcriptional regulator, partial [Pseudomonas sp. SIMBA_059]
MTEHAQQLEPALQPVDHPRAVVFVAYPQMGLLDLTGAQTVFWAATKAMAAQGRPGYRL